MLEVEARLWLLNKLGAAMPDSTALNLLGLNPQPEIVVDRLNRPRLVARNPHLTGAIPIKQLYEGAERLMAEQFETLPSGHAWREKGIHGLQTASEALLTYPRILAELPESTGLLLEVIAYIHDLGRPLQFARGKDPAFAGQHHGHFTVELLDGAGLLKQFPSDTAELIRYVIVHHADQDTPPDADHDLSQLPKELATLLVAMIRDVDKVGLFRNKTERYLHDPDEKRRQEDVLRRLNADYLGEVGSIQAARYLDEFAGYRTLDRKNLLTYEAYMLQFLAWIFDLNMVDSLRVVVECSAIQHLLDYFSDRLSFEQYSQIFNTIEKFLNQHGLEC